MNLRLLSLIFALLAIALLFAGKLLFAPARLPTNQTAESASAAVRWRSDQQLREPWQSESQARPFEFQSFTLQPLAVFQVRARILSREDYRLDNEAKLSPTDLALGWGRMADPAVYQQLAISQSGRWYHYRWQNQPPIPPEEIIASSANMHMIPANDAIAQQLSKLKPGKMVKIQGYLIEARNPQGWRWRSSLSRTDTGAGACEVVFVRAIEAEP